LNGFSADSNKPIKTHCPLRFQQLRTTSLRGNKHAYYAIDHAARNQRAGKSVEEVCLPGYDMVLVGAGPDLSSRTDAYEKRETFVQTVLGPLREEGMKHLETVRRERVGFTDGVAKLLNGEANVTVHGKIEHLHDSTRWKDARRSKVHYGGQDAYVTFAASTSTRPLVNAQAFQLEVHGQYRLGFLARRSLGAAAGGGSVQVGAREGPHVGEKRGREDSGEQSDQGSGSGSGSGGSDSDGDDGGEQKRPKGKGAEKKARSN
jgi:hypothetical protein